ncbi:Pentatricopeptide repeat-containing protein [Nymphaea thermarum]|nr:Pentatricopeptide repeat-containing protein [Nymphaea thermarum]
MGSLTGDAARLCRAILSASSGKKAARWSPLVEQALHGLGSRSILTPSLVSCVIMPGLIDHHPLALGFFDWAAQQPGFSHTPQTYQSLFCVLSRSKQYASIDKLFTRIRAQWFQLDAASYCSIIQAQLVCRKTQLAFSTFMGVERFWEIDGRVCNLLLGALSSDGHLELAEKLFERMRLAKMAFTNLGFGVFIGKLCRGAEPERLLGLLDGVADGEICGVNGSIVALLVADGLCRSSKTTEGWWVLEELRKRGCKPDFIAYSVVIESFRKLGCLEEAQMVLKQKRKKSVAPRIHEYKEFILSLIAEQRIPEAKEMTEAILGGNFPIDDDVYNELISPLAGIDADAAIAFFQSMVANDRFPSVDTLKNLSINLCSCGKIKEMSDIFKLLELKGFFSSAERYNVMVFFLCLAGKVKEAYGVLREMRRDGHYPDVVTYNTVMEACCREDMLRPARKLWDEMFATGCPGNLQTYNILIRKFSDSGEVDVAHRLFDHMLTRNILPNKITYSSLVKGFCRESKMDDAVEVLRKSLEQDIVLGGSTLSTLIHSLCDAGNFVTASKVMRQLVPCDLTTSDSHAFLLKNLVEEGHLQMAMEHIEWLRGRSPSKLQAVATELSGCLFTSLKPEPILQLLHVMDKKSSISDCGPWRSMLQKYLPELGNLHVQNGTM